MSPKARIEALEKRVAELEGELAIAWEEDPLVPDLRSQLTTVQGENTILRNGIVGTRRETDEVKDLLLDATALLRTIRSRLTHSHPESASDIDAFLSSTPPTLRNLDWAVSRIVAAARAANCSVKYELTQLPAFVEHENEGVPT